MFNRYTESARRAFFLARCQASRLGSPSIDTEHLLFGITQESAEAIKLHLKLDAVALREQLATKPVSSRSPASTDMPFDREVKRAIAYAVKEAKLLGRKSIEAEHLLLGIMREDHCPAAKALTMAGAPALADVRKSISASH
jgi:ATP-dependent Clp protease ATP-binding subunit ClpC